MTIRSAILLLAFAAAAPALAAPPEILPIQAERGPSLNIPGLPPIPMPPGSRVYGPNGERAPPSPPVRPHQVYPRNEPLPGSRPDRDAAEAEAREKEKQQQQQAAEAKKPAKSREEVIEDLFGRLSKAKDANEARTIMRGIERMWQISGSDTADLLMTRAREAVGKKNFKLAAELFDRIVALEPEWAEGWNQRATTRFYQDDDAGAVEDIGRALALEPRHFNALIGLGFILKRNEQKARALQAFKKALELNPQLENIKKQVDELTLDVDGRPI